jgi:hypothetical protein
MKQQGWKMGKLGIAILGLAASSLNAGCLSFCHPIDPPKPEVKATCNEVPRDCRNHVHIFFIHGLDPFDFANLSGVTDYVHSLGFIKTHYGQLYHVWEFKKEIRKVHEQDPEARFVLVGFSFGANMVRDVANAVKADGITIDLLIYLGGNTLENTEPNRPEHVARIINILAYGWIWHGATLDRAENVQYDNVWHFGSPTHPHTLKLLGEELALVACNVPLVYESTHPPLPIKPGANQPEQLPAPKATQSMKAPEKVGEWDFLKPVQGAGPIRGGSPFNLALETPPATMINK